MSSPLRITPPPRKTWLAAGKEPAPTDELRGYLERLVKLIPGEIVGLYMVGSGLIPAKAPIGLVCWFVFCCIALVIVRLYGTKDPARALPPQPKAVVVSMISFIIWVYSMGGPFAAFPDYPIHVPYIGSLLVLAWTFVSPYFYRGD